MRAREAKLDALVKTMDGATGEAKIETMATIIRELVQDEKAMHADMKDMHARMTSAH
jgi:chromosome condensin MukBEF ATPase and DNA-binding subunit MukB